MAVLPRPVTIMMLLDAGLHRLFDAVLDQRLVDQRQHFFWLSFGGGEKSGTETGGGEYRLADFSYHRYSILPNAVWAPFGIVIGVDPKVFRRLSAPV